MIPTRRKALRLPTATAVLWCLALGGCSEDAPSPELLPVTIERFSEESSPSPSDLPLVELAESDWPGWRGGLRHGVANADPPVQWSIHETRWSVPTPGRGNSSPVVCAGRVFLTAHLVDASSDNVSEQEGDASAPLAVLCYSEDTGELLWRREVGPAIGRTHRKNGYASATVACDGQRVVAYFGAAGLHCFDLDGEPLWSATVGAVEHPWGAASSPVIHRQRVFQLADGQNEASLVAFDVVTGRRLWTAVRESQGCWTTPTLVELDARGERTLLVVNGSTRGASSAGEVTAYDPATGAEVWRAQGTSDIPCPTIVTARDENGRPLLISATGGNGPIFAIRPDGQGDVTDTHVAWRRPTGGAYVPTGVYYEGRYYALSDGGALMCIRPSDGRTVWRTRLRGSFSASLVAASGRIYAVNERGAVYVVAAGDRYQLLAVNAMQERCLATPALSGTRIYLRTESHLHCIERNTAVATTNRSAETQAKDDAVGEPKPAAGETTAPRADAPADARRTSLSTATSAV